MLSFYKPCQAQTDKVARGPGIGESMAIGDLE